ncbi:hypothetical protein VOI54_06510 [Tamlana sp. 2201CG12-4]|uniref:hypothetical protein n=1 Tax=Tamlana sp. 2201CG12-4 TaxID=3112582 RepID=UPI002DB93DB2|nr:hypothetical protein [Tamlana sp. 2201CG12-4]MEC3906664.1 hypothetical protein [Tamlana sp. 2201CG12-4]
MRKINSLVLLIAITFFACETERTDTDELNLLESDPVAVDAVIEEVEGVLDDIVVYSDSTFGIEAISSSGSTSKVSSTAKDSGHGKRGRSEFFKACATIESEELDGVITTTITFSGDCEDWFGNVISGTITKVRAVSDTGKEKTVTIENLTINGYVINGTKTYTFVLSNDNGNPEMTGSVNITVETENGTRTKEGTRTVEITAGGDTDTCRDDEKTITGSSVYTNAEGASRSVTITTPLVKPAECRFIASGVKEYTREEGTTVLDYGDGTCDNVATKTSEDGTVTEIRLGKRRKHH